MRACFLGWPFIFHTPYDNLVTILQDQRLESRIVEFHILWVVVVEDAITGGRLLDCSHTLHLCVGGVLGIYVAVWGNLPSISLQQNRFLHAPHRHGITAMFTLKFECDWLRIFRMKKRMGLNSINSAMTINGEQQIPRLDSSLSSRSIRLHKPNY